MLHLMRILLIGLAVISVTSYPLQSLEASADPDDNFSYQQRSEALAEQLQQLRGSDPNADTVMPVVHEVAYTPAQQQKEALLADALNALIVGQTALVPYTAVNAPAIDLDADSEVSEAGAVAFLQMEDGPVAEDMPVEAPTESGDAEAQPVADPPAPPAPRVQTTDQVRESQESLVGQLQGLMRAVSAGADPMTAGAQAEQTSAGVTPIPTTPVVEGGSNETDPVVEVAPVVVRPRVTYDGDPLDQLVDIDFRDVDLTNVVAILALKADINIIAGAELRGVVTANLRQVPLRVAMETALRMSGLGMIEEEGIYFIVPYEEAASVNRKTVMIVLDKAEAREVQKVLEEMVSGIRDEAIINISTNQKSNTVVISAPKSRVEELVAMAHQLDVAEPVLPTITEAIPLNYADADDVSKLVTNMLTESVGKVAPDNRAQHLVITDLPVVIEQVKELIKSIDMPTKQVMIDTMVVDAVLNDEADTGVSWLIDSVERMSRRQAALGENGRAVGNLQDLSFLTDLTSLQDPGGLMTFSVLTDKIDWRGLIQMEVRNRNAHLVSNPVLMTLENEPAEISISQEIPYIELSQTGAGGSQTNTRFKDVGTIFTVTPKVSKDNTIIALIDGKESNLSGEFQGVPIEDKRQITSTMRMANGQTIFVGGLRKSSASSTAKKVPILGDVPVVNFLFRTNQRVESINELLVFLTCSVIPESIPDLTPYQQERFESAPPLIPRVDAWESTVYEYKHPEVTKEVQKKWRRGS